MPEGAQGMMLDLDQHTVRHARRRSPATRSRRRDRAAAGGACDRHHEACDPAAAARSRRKRSMTATVWESAAEFGTTTAQAARLVRRLRALMRRV